VRVPLLLRPRWLGIHLLALLAVLTCTLFGYLHFIVDGDDLYVGVATEQPDGSISTADGVLTRF